MTITMRFARNVRRLRAARGMTQAALAAKAGVSREYLARLEAARQDPTLRVAERIAKALGAPVTRLLDQAR
jgi:putative transcriptional regulator